MGAGASAGVSASLSNASEDQLQAILRKRVLQAFVLAETKRNVAWSHLVPIPPCYLRCSAPLSLDTEHRAIKIVQLNDIAALVQRVANVFEVIDRRTGAQMTWDTLNLYHVCDDLVKPLTLLMRCSFVSLLAEQAQYPKWFVSHWWGTPFWQTASLLNFHRLQRALSVDDAYWICTFANNQHDLAELGGGLEETPFAKAILGHSCDGTVALLDGEATTFSRIWCVFEVHISTVETSRRNKRHLYDLAAWLEEGAFTDDKKMWLPSGALNFLRQHVSARPSALLDDGNGQVREVVHEDIGGFPWKVAQKSVLLDISRAESSKAEDRHNILHMIVGTPMHERHQPPPVSHENYESLNRGARRRFAPAAMASSAQHPYHGQFQKLVALIQQFPDAVDDADANGGSPLVCAAHAGNASAVQVLLFAKANPNIRLHDGATATFLAAQNGDSAIIELLIGSHADVEMGTHDAVTPCFIAAQNSHVEALRLLIKAMADIDKAMIPANVTPLIKATQKGHMAVVELLLEARANASIRCSHGTALEVARYCNQIAVAAAIEKYLDRKLREEDELELAAAIALSLSLQPEKQD